MAEIRDRVFLATKTGDRDAPAARRSIEASLQRLRTDRLDLLQLHAVGDLDELDRVTRPGGALEAAVAAQEEGLVGAVGITGHGPGSRRHAPGGPAPLPVRDGAHPAEPRALARRRLPRRLGGAGGGGAAAGRGADDHQAVSRRSWPDAVTGKPLEPQAFATWYEPMSEPAQIRAAVSWALAHEEVAAIATAGDVRLLRHLVAAEADRQDPAEAEAQLQDLPGYSSPFLAMPA
jgi:aryl-alcohol dehydrogenase-like predicted oxidoreductase